MSDAPSPERRSPSRERRLVLELVEGEGARCVATLTGHTGTVLALALSAEGRTLFSGSMDRTVRVGDVG